MNKSKLSTLLATSILLTGCLGGSDPATPATTNTAPTLAAVDNQTTTEDGANTQVTLVGSDTDTGDTLTYSATSSTANVIVSVSGAVVTLNPADNWNGVATITAKVNDGTVDSTEQAFTLTVSAVNDAPTSTQIAATATATNTNKTVSATVQDVDGDALTYWAVSADTNRVTVTPTAASKGSVSATDALSGKSVDFVANPVAGVNGDTVITYYVSDSTAANVSKTFTLTVNASGSLPASASTINE